MEFKEGTTIIWYDTVGRIPIRLGIPTELTAPEAKTALQEFLDVLTELASLPNADKITIAEAYKMAADHTKK
jgi:hypothetical protein